MALRKKRITAASLAARNSGGGFFSAGNVSRKSNSGKYWIYLIIFLVGGIIYLFLSTNFKTATKAERIQTLLQNTKSVYKGLFTPEPVKFKVFGLPFLIRADLKDSIFWSKDFKKIVTDAEYETRNLLAVESLINTAIKKGEKIDLNDYPLIKEIFEASLLMKDTPSNITAGALNNLWLDDEGEFKVVEKENSDGTKSRSFLLPNESSVLLIAKKSDPNLISLENGILSVKSTEIEIDLTQFRESLYLRVIKEKIPKDMNYLVYFGNRHGMWKLPKEYVRWTVSIDNPFKVLDIQRGALKMMDEEGFFVITRRAEKFLESGNKKYEFPLDWRTGKTADKNIAALVIDKNVFKAKMLSNALFLSSENEILKLSEKFKESDFLVLRNDDSVFVPEKSKSIFLSKEDIQKAKADDEKRKKERLNELLSTKPKN